MPEALLSDRQYPQAIAAVTGTPWAMLEDRVQAMADVITLRSRGEKFSQDEVQDRLRVHQAKRLGAMSSLEGSHSSSIGPQIIDGVAVIPIYGVLAPKMDVFMQISGGTSTQELMAWIEEAATSPKVKGILLDIDSPGGDAHGNQEVADLLRQVRESLPVKAVVSNLGASAAYYIGSAAGELIASPSAEVGSIGVYYVHGEAQTRNEAAGVTYTVFRAGENKNLANAQEHLTDKARANVHERMTALYDQFVGSVASGRKTTVENVLANFGAGKLTLADRAVQVGMVDRVATLQTVFNQMRGKGAAASRPGSNLTAATVSEETDPMNPLVKQAAIAAGIATDSQSDETITASVHAYFAALGQSVPEDEKAVASTLLSNATTTVTGAGLTPAGSGSNTSVTTNAADVLKADSERRQNIRAAGQLLGIDAESIRAAEDDPNLSHEAASVQFQRKAQEANPPVGGHVGITGAKEDRLFKAAVDGLSARYGVAGDGASLAEGASVFSRCSGTDLVRACLDLPQHQMVGDDPLTLAAEALRGPDFDCRLDGGGFRAAAGTVQSPASLPNIMSAVLGKTLDHTLIQANTTFRYFARKLDSVPDLNPKEIIRTGLFGEFDLLPDGGEPQEDKFSEEANWYKVARYGKRAKLTPEMVINEQMGVFIDNVRKLGMGHERTLNRLCVDQLVSGTAGDGVSLFDSGSHMNVVSGGGTISVTQIDKMQLLSRAQKDVDNRTTLGMGLKKFLMPNEMDTTAQQVLRRDLQMVPATDDTVNPFRGQFDHMVEPLLSDVSASVWYGFTDPAMSAAIVYTYLRGFENMKRRFYFDNGTESRILDVQGAFAAAVNDWRGAVRNPGS